MGVKRNTVVLLCAGRIGQAVAYDLAPDFDVIAVDGNPEALQRVEKYGVEVHCADFTKGLEGIKGILDRADLVVSMPPGHMGYRVLEELIWRGKNVCDTSFFPEDPFGLNKLAEKMRVFALVDNGVAPGLSHMLAGYYSELLDVYDLRCYVGGLLKEHGKYKPPFSPKDVLEEYLREARQVKNGKVVTVPALSKCERIDFGGSIGELDAAITDGLRTLATTLPIPNMAEYTLRYPGHFDDVKRRIAEGTLEQLLSLWANEKDGDEFTLMRIVIKGKDLRGEGDEKWTLTLYDEGDKKTGLSSMARTTGFTCAAVARLMLSGKIIEQIRKCGIIPPEDIGRYIPYSFKKKILGHLASKGIMVQREFQR